MDFSSAYLLGVSAAVFVATSVMVAAVRWFHMCRPYDRHPRYYYPARPFMAASHLNALMLLPVVFAPGSADAFFLARLYFLPVALLHFTIMLFAYFGSVMQWRKWRTPMLIISIPVLLVLLATFIVALWGGDWMAQGAMPLVGNIVLYSLGLIMTGVGFIAIRVVRRWAAQFHQDDFSNQADFPTTQARLWTMLISVNVVLCWTAALAQNPVVLSVVMLLLTVIASFVLITALHPHRSKQIELEEEAQQEEFALLGARVLTAQRRQEVLSAVRSVVEEQGGCLDPHLTLQDVASRSGFNRSYVSAIIKEEYGGFFDYVNCLRLAHVDAYLKEHPQATLQEAVLESGFNSRQAYYSVKGSQQSKQ